MVPDRAPGCEEFKVMFRDKWHPWHRIGFIQNTKEGIWLFYSVEPPEGYTARRSADTLLCISDRLRALSAPALQAQKKEEEERKSKASRDARQRSREMDEKVSNWVPLNVKPGDRIKVRGARDGHGIRIVLGVKPDHLECRQVNPEYKAFNGVVPESMGCFTTHGFDKVVKVLVGKSWVSVRKLLS